MKSTTAAGSCGRVAGSGSSIVHLAVVLPRGSSMVLMLGMIFFLQIPNGRGFWGTGRGRSIHGRVEKVSEDEKGGIGNNTRCCVGIFCLVV